MKLWDRERSRVGSRCRGGASRRSGSTAGRASSPRSVSRSRSRCSRSASAGRAPTSRGRCSAPSSSAATGSSCGTANGSAATRCSSYSVHRRRCIGALTGPIALGAISCVAAGVLFERILRFAFGRVGVGRRAVVRARQRHQPHRRAHHVRVRRRARTRRDLRAATPPADPRGRRRGAVLAREPARRRVPRARGDRVGVRATRAAHDTRSRVAAGALAPIADDRGAVPEPGQRAVRTVGARSGTSRCASRSCSRPAAAHPGCAGAPRAYAARRRRRRSSFPPRSAATSAGSASTSPVRCSRARCSPAAGCSLAVLAIPLLIWQWYPAVDGIAFARTDPSTRAAYYTPVAGVSRTRRTGPIGRVEIPSTYRHWEAAYAAPHAAARAWVGAPARHRVQPDLLQGRRSPRQSYHSG